MTSVPLAPLAALVGPKYAFFLLLSFMRNLHWFVYVLEFAFCKTFSPLPSVSPFLLKTQQIPQVERLCAEYWAYLKEFLFFLRAWPLNSRMPPKLSNAHKHSENYFIQLFLLLLVDVLICESYSIFSVNRISTFILNILILLKITFFKTTKYMEVLLIHVIESYFN